MTDTSTNTPSDVPGTHYTTIATAWRPPAPSRGTRKISRRSKGSSRAVVIGYDREIHCESEMERKCALMLLARPDVADVVEQPPAVIYRDTDGRTKRHTFDFLATMVDGSKTAIEVKPAAKVEKYGWRERLARIARHADGLADKFVVVTEACLPPDEVSNAALLHFARRDADPELDEQIRQAVRDLHGAVTIADLLARSGLHGDGFTAVVRLIGGGELLVHSRGRLGPSTLVSRAKPT
jgi:hypothetical protein